MNPQQNHVHWSRRSFLQLSLASLGLIGSRILFPDSALAHSAPSSRLRLYNVNTKERIQVTYRNQSGHYDQGALKDLNHFFRCPHSQQVHQIDIRLIEYVNRVEKLVGGGKEVRIYSAYRSPSYNRLLVRLGRGAAPKSLHTMGKAIDFSIPGVRLSKVRRAAFNIKWGGVGYYPRRGFIHLDTGSVRYW